MKDYERYRKMRGYHELLLLIRLANNQFAAIRQDMSAGVLDVVARG